MYQKQAHKALKASGWSSLWRAGRCYNRCSRDRFSKSRKDLLNCRQRALRSTLVLHLSEKSKGSRPESISRQCSTVKTLGIRIARPKEAHSTGRE
ncbi:hypothetical protein UY3_12540 [Chelonia mydas]|uniref:Uncharacterized protein n=1 Tax=Chelonia mydas TaxID=8469 RepID=M7BQE6_CHEMY|nr:hypothetical protein UY3_12540 [Chelonia mydas]